MKSCLTKYNKAEDSDSTKIIKKLLSHWSKQSTYFSNDSSCYESINFKIAKFSKSPTGKCIFKSDENFTWQWSFDKEGVVIFVNINVQFSNNHDAQIVSVIIFEEKNKQISKNENYQYSDDPWIRSIQMTKRLISECFSDKAIKSKLIDNMNKRLEISKVILNFIKKWANDIKSIYLDRYKEKSNIPENISLGINDWYMPCDKIGVYISSCKLWGFDDWGVIIISKKSIKDVDYLFYVILHELIHAVLDDACDIDEVNGHSDKFMTLADDTRLPEKYRN